MLMPRQSVIWLMSIAMFITKHGSTLVCMCSEGYSICFVCLSVHSDANV